MKCLILALLLAPIFSEASTEVIRISSDRATYAAGEKAVLRAMLASKPDNSVMEFDVEGELDGEIFPITRITDFEFYSVTPPLAAGVHELSATVYLQDARLARDLKASISYFASEIARIDLALETATDPNQILELQAAKAKYQNLLAATQTQLASIRTEVFGPVAISIQVN